MKRISIFFMALLGIILGVSSPAQAQTTHDGYAVFVINNVGFETLNLYMWGDVNNLNGKWPGMSVTGTETIKGITYQYFDMGADNNGKSESLIFSDNGKNQLKDFGYTISRNIYLELTKDSIVREITNADSIPDVVIAKNALWPAYTTLLSEQPKSVRILSMNNSLIHYGNEWQDDMFNQMATAQGVDAQWTAHTNLGKTLQYHYDEGEGLTEAGTPSARMLVRTQAWTHIILQEQTAKPRTNFEGFRSSVKAWVEYIRTNCPNPNAVIILPINWAYNTDPFTEYNTTFLANYQKIAQEFGVVLCPVGLAYQVAYNADNKILSWWFKDDRHPTQAATYAACCLEYATIMGVNPSDITWQPTTLTADTAALVRQYADLAAKSFSQVVDQHKHTIHYEIHAIDNNGLSTGAVSVLGDTTLSTKGIHTITTTYLGETLTATVAIDTAVTQVITTPAIAFNDDAMTYSQDFNTLGGKDVDPSTDVKTGIKQGSTLPKGWRIERNTSAPRTIGSYNMACDTTMYIGGQSLVSNAYNGTWNFGATGSDDRALGGLTTGVANATRGINVMTHLTNDGTTNYPNIVISYDIEKYRNGSNPEGFSVQLYYSTNGSTWTSAGSKFCTAFPADGNTNGSATVPMSVTSVSDTLAIDFVAGTDLYLAWNISVTNGTTCNAAPGYAIDNVSLEVLKKVVPPVAHYIYANDQTGWSTLALYAWGTAELYGSWPGIYPTDTKEINSVTYKVFPYDVTTAGSYNLIFNNGNNGSQAKDFEVTEARDYYLNVTATSVTEVGSGVNNTISSENYGNTTGRKILYNSQLLIEKNGHLYNLLGAELQ